jgi:hypothetical protein
LVAAWRIQCTTWCFLESLPDTLLIGSIKVTFAIVCSAIEHRVRLNKNYRKLNQYYQIFFDDNCDNIPRQSTSCRGEGYYFQQRSFNNVARQSTSCRAPGIYFSLSFLTHVFVILHAGGGVKELRDKRYKLRVLD